MIGFVYPELFWLIIGVSLFMLELALPGFVMFFFALGGLLTALVCWLVPLDIVWQLAIFIVASMGSLFALRDVIQRRFMTKPADKQQEEGKKKDDDRPLISPGDKGVVCETIPPPAQGRIKCNGTYWRASADELIEEGEIIEVVRQDALTIHVEKV